jgi:hypothetical protein
VGLGQAERSDEVAAEFLGEIDRDAGMDAALPVEEPSFVVERDDGAVPNVRMNVEATAAVAPERDELFRCHVIARQGQRNDKALFMKRIEQLAAVGMVIGAPDQRLPPRPARALGCGFFRPIAPAEQITVALSRPVDEQDRKIMVGAGITRLVPQNDAAYDGIRDLVKILNIDLAKLS